jgi:hypothetical protein
MGGRGLLRFVFAPLPVALLATFLLPTAAAAAECGDDVDGRRVACACGDTVVSDTKLLAGDPIASGRCREGGLVIRAAPLAETLVLDLGGLALVGSGVGDGIACEAGGSDGAVIVGGTTDKRGEIVGFGVGINVRRPASVRRIEAVDLKGQRHQGLLLRSAGTFVRDVRASRNGSDGVRVSGQGGRLVGIESYENAGAGVRLVSRFTVLEARAERNRTHGIVVRGSAGDLGGSVASDNRGYGIVLAGYGHRAEGVVTERNSVGTIVVTDRRDRPQ